MKYLIIFQSSYLRIKGSFFLVLWVDHYGGVWSNQLYPKGFIIALISIYNYNNRDISRFLKKNQTPEKRKVK